jgi:putative flippase GtrA
VIAKNSSQKVRFLTVGVANTAIDFGLLFTLKALGLPAISANIISTTAAFCFSFVANKKYTFKSTGANLKREIGLFVVVTLFALWVIQTIVINITQVALSDTGLDDGLILLIAKILATAFTLVWNYTLYSRVVFKKPPQV